MVLRQPREDLWPEGELSTSDGLSYRETGLDNDAAHATTRDMARSVNLGGPGVLNAMGAFASLVDGRFADERAETT